MKAGSRIFASGQLVALPLGLAYLAWKGKQAKHTKHALAVASHRQRHRLLPAILRRDGADVAHGGDPRAGRVGVRSRHPRLDDQGVSRARPRRALVGRGLVRGHRLGAVRSDAVAGAGVRPGKRRRCGERRARRDRQRDGPPTQAPRAIGRWRRRGERNKQPVVAGRPGLPGAPRGRGVWALARRGGQGAPPAA